MRNVFYSIQPQHKKNEAESIQADVRAFLERGGKITQIIQGASNVEIKPLRVNGRNLWLESTKTKKGLLKKAQIERGKKLREMRIETN